MECACIRQLTHGFRFAEGEAVDMDLNNYHWGRPIMLRYNPSHPGVSIRDGINEVDWRIGGVSWLLNGRISISLVIERIS